MAEGMALLSYALRLPDAVFVIGEAGNLFLHARNLRLLKDALHLR